MPHSPSDPADPDRDDPINVTVEELRRQLLAAEQTNAELRRLGRLTGQGAWKSPLILLVLLLTFLGGAWIGHGIGERRRPPAPERIE